MRSFLERMICDRCGGAENFQSGKVDNTWMILTISPEKKERHLCPECSKEFNEWWRAIDTNARTEK